MTGAPALSAANMTNFPSVSQNIVTGSRTVGSVYHNATGKTMWVMASVYSTVSAGFYAYSDSNSSPAAIVGAGSATGPSTVLPLTWLVPSGYYYKITCSAGTPSVSYWAEWY